MISGLLQWSNIYFLVWIKEQLFWGVIQISVTYNNAHYSAMILKTLNAVTISFTELTLYKYSKYYLNGSLKFLFTDYLYVYRILLKCQLFEKVSDIWIFKILKVQLKTRNLTVSYKNKHSIFIVQAQVFKKKKSKWIA